MSTSNRDRARSPHPHIPNRLAAHEDQGPLRPLLLLCAIGVLLRAAFLWLSPDLDFQSDEANYVYLATTWKQFGFYSDSYRYYWPPGYPFLLRLGLDGFGAGAIQAIKWLQVACSASVGLTTMLFARRLFGARAARLAGIAWCLYLPLIAFTHYLWSETIFLALFLPSQYLLLRAAQEPERARDRDFALAGVLMAGVLYLKDAPLFLVPLLALGIFWLARGQGALEALRRASLFLGTLGCCLLPWTLRNYEVYGRFIPVGSSLGENAFVGLNESYKNFDLTAYERNLVDEAPPSEAARPWFVESQAGSDWRRAEEILNTADRMSANTRRGLDYAREHPGWLLRTRIKKLADLVAPYSFFIRHQALGHYADSGSVLGAVWLRRSLVIWALLCPTLLLLCSLPAVLLVLRGAAARWVLGTVLVYFSATSLLVSMSRFRIPMVPFLIVLSAGLIAERPLRLSARAKLGVGLVWAVLAFLWWVDAPEILQVLELAGRSLS